MPRTELWGLLYAQVTQADQASQRNVLLGRTRLTRQGLHERPLLPPGVAGALWTRKQIDAILAELALPAGTPLSVIMVETLGDVANLADPLGGDLGHVRILRASPLTPVPALC